MLGTISIEYYINPIKLKIKISNLGEINYLNFTEI